MKFNYLVSDLDDIRIKENRNIFLSDPYLFYRLNTNYFDNVEVANYTRSSKSDLNNDYIYIESKFDKYIEILTERLNNINKKKYSKIFWERALSISFYRHLVYTYEMFICSKKNFNPNKHECNILSPESYLIPTDFEEHRQIFQHSNIGQEQLFSIYINCFYSESNFYLRNINITNSKLASSFKNETNQLSKLFYKIQRNLNLKVISKILTKILIFTYKNKDPNLVIIGSFFSNKMINRLLFRSNGRIKISKYQFILNQKKVVDFGLRKILSETNKNFDDFDKYFFSTLPYCMPKIYIENFEDIISQLHIQKFNFKYVTSEAWLSDSKLSIYLSYLKEIHGIKLIYNEHNYYEHPWIGSLVNRESKLCDIYLTLGWKSNNINNLVTGSSLAVNFQYKAKKKKKHTITYISSGAAAKRPAFSSSYGWCAENAPLYYIFINNFFKTLSKELKSKILFRYYPIENTKELLLYEQNYMIEEDLLIMKKNNDIKTQALKLMSESELVIVDYLSTSYIEALIMNVPTIFFWNRDTYFISEEYKDFFKNLCEVKICQTNPIEAAEHVQSIIKNPAKWWHSTEVQKARTEFLKKNFGKPENMLNYLVNISKV